MFGICAARDLGHLPHELHRGKMARDHLAKGDAEQVAVLVDDRVERIDIAEHAHDLELLLVQRVALQVARRSQRVLHEPRVMERADRFGMRHARRDHLAPTGISRHEMRLDQAGDNFQVSLNQTPVELHRRAPGRGEAKINVLRVVARKMIHDFHFFQYPRIADQLGQFVALVGTMQPGGDEHANTIERERPRRSGPRSSAEGKTVGHRAG